MKHLLNIVMIGCVNSCDDGNNRIVANKQIDYTDFSLDEIAFYFTDNVIMLPSEY